MGDPTMPGVKGKGITEAVYRYLQDVYPESVCAPFIARATKHNLNTVKGALIRLHAQKRADRVEPGYFRAKDLVFEFQSKGAA